MLGLKNQEGTGDGDGNEEEKNEARGDTAIADVKSENLILVFGCPPSVGVKANTKMCYDLANALDAGYEKARFTLQIPEVFELLEGRDNAFEMIQSNSLQPLGLVYQHNVMTKSIGVVFTFGTQYVKEFRKTREAARNLLASMKLTEVTVYTDLNKAQTIEKLDLL